MVEQLHEFIEREAFEKRPFWCLVHGRGFISKLVCRQSTQIFLKELGNGILSCFNHEKLLSTEENQKIVVHLEKRQRDNNKP